MRFTFEPMLSFASRRLDLAWRAIICAYLFVLASPVSALPANRPLSQCRLDTWGIRDGMPGYDVTAIQQTPDGFIWIGTTNGLVRFDGDKFVRFDHTNVNGLTNDTIRGLGLDGAGELLVGAEWCGFGTLVNGVYRRIPYPDTGWNATHYFHTSPDGVLWVGYQGWNYVLRVAHGDTTKITVPGAYVNGMVDLPGGSALVSLEYGGLFTISPDGTVKKFQPQLEATDFTALAQDTDGSIWAGTDANGIYVYRHGKIDHYTTANGLASNLVLCLCPNREGRVWIGTNRGIDCLSANSGASDGRSAAKPRFEHFDVSNGLLNDEVSALTEDREGNLWAGTSIGLNRIAPTRLTPLGIGAKANDETGSIAPYGDDTILCASPTGLWRIGSSAGAVAEPILTGDVTGAIDAGNGDVVAWERLGPGNGRFMVVRRHGGIWTAIGGVDFQPFTAIPSGNGFDLYGINGRLQHVPGNVASRPLWPGLAGTLPNNNNDKPQIELYSVKQGPDGSTILATTMGLVIYKNGRYRLIDLGLPPDTHVLGVDVSDPTAWWVGTDGGLIRYSAGKATCYGLSSGLPADSILQVLRDRHGTIWAAGYFGIASVTPKDFEDYDHKLTKKLKFTLYTAADGLRAYPGVREPAETNNGALWFTGYSGITLVQPDSIQTNTLAPNVAIEEATANGVSLSPQRRERVRPGTGSFTVRYSALSYVEPELVRFRYKLIGFDTAWIDADTRHTASYTNLPPRRYTFRVLACNNDGVWNNTGASLTFESAPHYYETIWFRALAILAAGMLIAVVFGVRTSQLRRRNLELEHRIADRTAELVERNDELQMLQSELEERQERLEDQQAELEARNSELTEARSQLEEQNTELDKLATTDGLTGAYNRRSLQTVLKQEMLRSLRYDNQISLIMLDVDTSRSTMTHLATRPAIMS